MERTLNYANERKSAIDAVLRASQLCRRVRTAMVSAESLSKKDKSPVTVADFGAQAVVAHVLQQRFPEDPLTAEEDSAELRRNEAAHVRTQVIQHVQEQLPELNEAEILASIDRGKGNGGPRGRFWVLDPIDGTKGFLRGEQYAIALAMIEDGEPVLGVLGCPNLPINGDASSPTGCIFVGVKGQGAFVRPLESAHEQPVRVSPIADPTNASFCESVESGHSSHGDAAKVAELLGVTAAPVRIDSQCKYAAVARGDASIYLRLPTIAGYQERIWDHAAGWRVIKEAGGEVTDVRGQSLDFTAGRTLARNIGVVGTNGLLHEQVIAAVRQVLGL